VIAHRRRRESDADGHVPSTAPIPAWVPHAVFYVLATLGILSFARAGTFGRVNSWAHYDAWIHARAANFERIGFAEFVNLYVLVPTAAAWAVLATPSTSIRLRIARWVPPVAALVISLLLFQRKAAISVVLLVAFAWLIDIVRRRARGVRRLLVATSVAVIALYLAVVVAPVYSRASNAVSKAQAVKEHTSKTSVSRRELRALANEIGIQSRTQAIAVYSIVSPLTRSSAPALYYPVIFPREHPYFHFDLGQDIAGIGSMPNDNIVVWNYLNPNLPGGTEMVPYQFVLYSQIGTAGAVAFSVLVGVLLALAWMLSQSRNIRRPWNALLGALILLWAAYIGIDSLRNSTVVSYGLVWGVLFVGVVAGVARIVSTRRRRDAPLTVAPSASLEPRRTSRAAVR
jgi:hypothetical protein